MSPQFLTKLYEKFDHHLVMLLFYVWLTYNTCNAIDVQCIDKERQALLEFKHGIRVDKCGLLSSWGRSNPDCCQWDGIRCDSHTGHVVMLHLPGFSSGYNTAFCLQGTVSVSLTELRRLRHLDLSFNDFRGQSIPKFIGTLSNLEYLNLANALFGGVVPAEIGNLTRLSSLNLNCLNDTSCSIRAENLGWISHLRFLRDINLGGIDLSLVPKWASIVVNNLPLLEVLRMDSCTLSIKPVESSHSYVNSSNRLRVVSLSGNRLNDTTIFRWLYNLTSFETSLVYLDLSSSQISGEIPSFIWKSTTISHLDLSENGFIGQISSEIKHMQNLSFLNLDYNHLSGNIPNEIWTIQTLSYLSVSLNRLQGFIPNTILNLKRLSVLDLSGNDFRLNKLTIHALGKLCRLQILRLDGNNLTHDCSQVIQSLFPCAHKTLVSLSLTNTQLWGSIPNNISEFLSLETLYVGDNQLNGTIDQGIGQLSRLKELDLSFNYLNGVVSDGHFSDLSNLSVLALSYNPSLVINVSSNWSPPFQLVQLGLTFTRVGPKFPKWLKTQKNITYVDISESGICDSVPTYFWTSMSSTIQYLNMSNNIIYGTFPNLPITFQVLAQIDMSSNNLSGTIPSFLGTSVTQINLNNNQLSQGLSRFLCPTTKMSLIYLDLSNNLFFETIPDCWTYFPQLTVLKLENNKISGNLSPSIGALSNLQALHLRNNSLNGKLPESWMNLTFLTVLDLAYNSVSGPIPRTFGHGFKNLNILSLRNNNFSRAIPSSLCQLSCLQIMDLSGNHISGTLPNCLNNLSAMANTSNFTQACANIYIRPNWLSDDIAWLMWKRKEHSFADSRGLFKGIDISNNKLQGRIPDNILSLVGIVFLNLSQNNLSGVIPSKIGQLTSIQFLDLSHNQLYGEIPTSLASINYLEILDLSMNNLSGKIPLGTQLQGFDASTYKGNPTLCGAPLPKCLGDEVTTPTQVINGDNVGHLEDNDNNEFMLGLYISVVLGIIVGFWGFFGTLVLKRSWRHAFFRVIDDTIDKVYVFVALKVARAWNGA
ncbi:hypothetical protein RND81_14G108300 [Saponaria officinalis]|uniref:Leucine-rich repeat-containing N-terminal plant-type domain-containing protein n=1 Tax=Saponaria officinalis TaxID=3572 RepID=A0AAW1GNU2_SAPOF